MGLEVNYLHCYHTALSPSITEGQADNKTLRVAQLLKTKHNLF